MSGVDLTAFRQDVYNVVAAIPRGKVMSYGQIAELIGRPTNARLVGHILRRADEALTLPCHRVVNSQGRPVPHWPEQRTILVSEGVVFKSSGCVDMHKCQWKYDFSDPW